MSKKQYFYIAAALTAVLLTSACGKQLNSDSPEITSTQVPVTTPENAAIDENADSAHTSEEILIIVDQTPKPIEGNSFDFVVNRRPEGFALAEMEWVSEKNRIVNSVPDAIAHGANGEDGFYISGDGQFMGFFYPDTMKGEQGQVMFLFTNEQGQELTWKKEITLN
ncbi:hypothetical protein [Paenibacillus sp. sgz500958]|uniref:hypothetical protein n=1 Tax=Paenibacillus sp. sgz500958 TaxID=3242475 RepID=UPI0036D28F93